jgi:PhnB protein
MSNVHFQPEGYHTTTPYLALPAGEGEAAIDFYKKAFNAEELSRMPGQDGKGIGHAEIRIGDSPLMMGEECPQMPTFKSPKTVQGTTVSVVLYVKDVDQAFKQAIDAGATAQMPPQDMFWGDRYGKLQDPFGHEWGMATHIEDVSPEEMKRRMDEMFKKMAEGGGCCGGGECGA